MQSVSAFHPVAGIQVILRDDPGAAAPQGRVRLLRHPGQGLFGQIELILIVGNRYGHLFHFETIFNRYDALILRTHLRPVHSAMPASGWMEWRCGPVLVKRNSPTQLKSGRTGRMPVPARIKHRFSRHETACFREQEDRGADHLFGTAVNRRAEC